MLLSRSLKTVVLGCAVMALAALGGCDRQSSENAQPRAGEAAATKGENLTGVIDRSHKGSLLPDFTLTDVAGQKLRLQSLKGRPLLINLWATWCPPCVVELPMLDQLAAKRAGELKVLTVSQDFAQTEKVAPFLAAQGASHLEGWLDPENELSAHYATGSLPTTIFYNAQGREVWRFIGEHDWTSPKTTQMLAEGLLDSE